MVLFCVLAVLVGLLLSRRNCRV